MSRQPVSPRKPLRRGAGWCAALALLLLLPVAVTAAAPRGTPVVMPPAGVLVNTLPHHKAYAPGEMLAYSIEWSGIPAGHAVMSVLGGTDASGRKEDRLVSIAKSNKVVSLVYRVRDRIMSEIDPVTGVPRRISVEQRHGRRNRIYVIDFDQARHEATSRYQGKDPVTVDIPPNAHDIISCLYYLRSLDGIEPGATKIVDVHEGKKNWRLLVFAEDRERVHVPAGTFDTIRVRAEVRFEGVFFDRGDVRLWLTDDRRHVPVRVSIKIKLGEVLSELTNMALPPLAEPEATAALGHAEDRAEDRAQDHAEDRAAAEAAPTP